MCGERGLNAPSKHIVINVAFSRGDVVEWVLPNLIVRWLISDFNDSEDMSILGFSS